MPLASGRSSSKIDPLVKDAWLRVLAASDAVGIRGMVVPAIGNPARAFYLAMSFQESPVSPMTLMIPLKSIRDHLTAGA